VHDWLNLLADAGSVDSIPGDDESLAAARVSVRGHRVVAMWCRFDVAAGTLSVAAGQRLSEAIDAAIADRVPVVAVANSGGARMQEGTRAFVQMIVATRAVRRLRDAGLCLVVYLADPTTGGVFASWASLGHVTFAEPAATIGFTGPRVAEVIGEPIEPARNQTAEGLFANGQVDAIVAPTDLAAAVANVLDVVAAPDSSAVAAPTEVEDGPTGWDAVVASRQEGRSRVADELFARSTAIVELSGDRSGAVDEGVRIAMCRLAGRRVMLIAHRDPSSRPTAAGLRSAQRAMHVAEELGLSVVTVIDTPGAHLSGEQEREGFAGEIARSIDTLTSLSVPTVAVVAGQGSGGAALAWMAADRVLAASDGWVAPIAPEAASVIVHRDTDHAGELADQQQVSAIELRKQGIVSAVYDAGDLADAVLATLDELTSSPRERRRRS
jgi:acetyl-CoA carboxylase carboxyl transferase subunit beta